MRQAKPAIPPNDGIDGRADRPWEGKDLNLQKPKPPDLQSGPLPVTGYPPKSRREGIRTDPVSAWGLRAKVQLVLTAFGSQAQLAT